MNENVVSKTECPPLEMLQQLVTGSLNEQYAGKLFRHLDDCHSCQRRMDDLDQQGSDLIDLARQAEAKRKPQDPESLGDMIRRAQQEARTEETRSESKNVATRVDGAGFLDGFRRSGLLREEDVESCLNEIRTEGSVNFDDSGSIAQALVNRQKLTAFQARVLLRGRWKGLMLGNYAILDSLGQGGMGNVFKAKHKRLGRVVCLKVINSAGRNSQIVIDRFRNEAKALARLSHPNIVTAHDADESKGVPFLVMEYIEGSDLAKHVRAHGPLPIDQTLQACLQTARALEYAHGQGVIHRDVKPHNLFLVHDRETGKTIVKVLDLGLARFDSMPVDNPDASLLTAMTNTGVVIGTVDYMSPEQALDSRKADARSDIYSLGCTMHFLLTGRAPFQGETMMQRLIAHREQEVPSLCDSGLAVPMNVDMCIQQMLAKDPDDRYQSMGEVAEDLTAMLCGDTPSCAAMQQLEIDTSNQSGDANRLRRRKHIFQQRGRWESLLPIAAACTVLCLLLGGAYAMFGDRLLNRSGARNAIVNGGDGRVLLVVSHDWFNETKYKAVAGNLRSRGIEVVTASPREGKAKEEFGVPLKREGPSIYLSQFRAGDYDAVYFLPGSTDDLKHKKDNATNIGRLIDLSLQRGLMISSIGHESWSMLHAVTSLPKSATLKSKDKIEIGNAKDSSSPVLKVLEINHWELLLNESVKILSKQKLQVEKNAWWEKLL